MENEFHVSLSYPNPSLGQMSGARGVASEDRQPISGDPRPATPIPTRARPTGARQTILIISLLVGLLFATFDTSIVSTSLVTISHELNDFVNAPWIVLSYLLTYMGFAVFIAKLSDIYGRRNMLAVSWVIFIGFSLGCSSSKDMTALIICRAFQGIGASGLYSLTQIGLVEVGPIHRPSLIGALIGATLAIAFVLGPILGGVISQLSDWRWLFNLNIPFGLLTILAITNLWPDEETDPVFSWKAFKKIDFIGSLSLLFGSGLLVFALQQAGSQTFAWGSGAIVSSLVISSLCCLVFIGWETLVGLRTFCNLEPIFPIQMMLNRVYASALLITFLTGFPYIALCIVIPERFQIVYGQSVLMAGVHILPLLGACAAGSFFGGALSSKRNNTSYTLIGASSLQLLGCGLMMLGSATSNGASQYGFQVIFGLGVGLSLSAATIMTNILATEQNQKASAQGAIAQARVLGGCIGLSICTIVFNNHVNKYLSGDLTPAELEVLHRSPLSGLSLPGHLRELVKTVYRDAFAEEIKIMAIVCAVMVAASLFTIEKHPAPLEQLTTANATKEEPSSRRESDSGTELNEIRSVHQQV